MDARKKEIDQLKAEVGRLEQQITAECISIGKRIAELDHRGVHHAELGKYLTNVDSLLSTITTYHRDIEKIQATVRRIRELGAQMQENEKRARSVQRERESKYVEIGAGSYTVFKNLEDRTKYRPYFEDLLKIDAEIDHLHQELQELEKEEKTQGFLKKLIVYKGKKVLRRGDISRVEKDKIRAYSEASKRLVDSDFGTLATGDLRILYDLDAERRKEIEKIQKDNDNLKAEAERGHGELKHLGVEEEPGDKIKEIEKRIGDVKRELDVMHCWTGQLFVERDLRNEVPDTTLGTKFDIVGGVRESIRKKQSSIYRLMAELEGEELAKKDKNLKLRRKQLEEEMRVKERQIGVIDLEIAMGTKRMEELRRVLTGEAPYSEPSPLPPTPDFYNEKTRPPGT